MIVIVSDVIPPVYSGAGKRIYGFYAYLLEKKFNVKLITTVKNDDENIITLKCLKNKSKIAQMANLVFFFPQLLFMAYKLKEKDNVNWVWLTATSMLTFSSSLVFKMFNFKIITQNTLVGSDDPISKYKKDIFGIKYNLKKQQYKFSDKVTSNSKVLYDISIKAHSNCSMIANPLLIKPKLNFNNQKNKVLFLGALCYRKGLDIVFKTIDVIHKNNRDIEFYFVGSEIGFSVGLKNTYDQMSNINKQNVRFLGLQQDIVPWLEYCDILFFPSRREGFPSILIEAMASGLPIVAKQLDGITDYIFGDDYETILDTEDPQTYADTILNILSNNARYMRLSDLGLALVKRFDKDTIFRQYIELFS